MGVGILGWLWCDGTWGCVEAGAVVREGAYAHWPGRAGCRRPGLGYLLRALPPMHLQSCILAQSNRRGASTSLGSNSGSASDSCRCGNHHEPQRCRLVGDFSPSTLDVRNLQPNLALLGWSLTTQKHQLHETLPTSRGG